MTLNESIRYRNGDAVEGWLNHLLCLDASLVPSIASGCPSPENCELYYVDRQLLIFRFLKLFLLPLNCSFYSRDSLFSYDKASEAFLQRVMSLMVSSHYKVSIMFIFFYNFLGLIETSQRLSCEM